MNKNKFKRVLSIALATVMVAGTIAYTLQGASEVQAAPTATAAVKDINLGTVGLANTESKVYYGLDTSSTIPKVNSNNSIAATSDYTKTTANNLWRVLDASSGLLFADDIIAERRYDDSSNAWDETNELYNWLNGTTYKTNSDKFTTIEQGAIATNTDGDMRLLTIEEVKNTAYGFTNDVDPNAARTASSWWWLRSTGYAYNVATVEGDGYVFWHGETPEDKNGSVRPAFNLNLSSVIFSSASGASKSSFESVGTDKVSTNIWKLTLKDSSKTVSVTSGESVTQSGQTVTVPYTYTGSDVSQISIMITDKAYTESDASILYYGALNTTLATTGTGTFELPTSLPDGYKIYMMAEDVNGDTLTDYSSTPVEITSVVTITNPADSHITLSTEAGNGTETQSVLTGAMTSVVYTADDGYYFPTTYTVTGSNGITVTRDDYTQITVSGTPTADASITLEAATEKESQEAPSVTDGVDKISGTTTAMEYASSESATTWTTCSDGNTKVAAGTWYVRYAATDTKKAGTAASVVVTTTLSTPTYTITAGAGQTHELSTDETLSIICDGALNKLTGIYVDDKLVDAANYTLKSGSTILTFKATYLNTLSAGTHKVKFQYDDGSVESTFLIKETSTQDTTTPFEKDEVPKTGDSTPSAGLFIIAIISGAGVVYFGRKKKTVR